MFLRKGAFPAQQVWQVIPYYHHIIIRMCYLAEHSLIQPIKYIIKTIVK